MCQCRRSWRKSWRFLLVKSSATLGQASGDSTGGRALVGKQIVDGPVPQIQEKIVEVIRVILREQCQRMCLFTFGRRVVVEQLVTGVFGGLGEGRGSLAKAQATARVDVPTTLSLPLCSRSWWLERGPYSCLAMMKMKVNQHEKLSYTFSESHWCTESTCQELIEWLGAWVRKQGFLHWVLLWDCASVHRKASLLEWIRTAHPECHVLFIPGGYTAELQPADIAIQQPLKHSIKQQAEQFFAESVCPNEAVLELRLSTMKHLLQHWVLHTCAEVEKNTSITTKAWRHLSWTLFDATEVEHEEPPEEEDLILHDDDDDDGADDPESTGTAVAEASTAVADGSTAVADGSELSPTVAAEVARAERFLYLRCAYGKHPPKP